MEMIAMLGGLGQNPGPLVIPQGYYTGMTGMRAPMLAALGADEKKDEPWYRTTWGMVGIGAVALGVLWHLSRSRDGRDYDAMADEARAQESMERGLPIRTDGLRGKRRSLRGLAGKTVWIRPRYSEDGNPIPSSYAITKRPGKLLEDSDVLAWFDKYSNGREMKEWAAEYLPEGTQVEWGDGLNGARRAKKAAPARRKKASRRKARR